MTEEHKERVCPICNGLLIRKPVVMKTGTCNDWDYVYYCENCALNYYANCSIIVIDKDDKVTIHTYDVDSGALVPDNDRRRRMGQFDVIFKE